MKNTILFFYFVSLFTLSLSDIPLYGQEMEIYGELDKPPYRVPKVDTEISVDAYLNEPLWSEAVKIDVNIEVRPAENAEAPVRTEVLMAYNDSHIFVGFIAYDPEPEKIRVHYCDRDNIFDDDWVLILFDTFNDQRRTYDFACNPLGIQGDMIETPTSGGGEWDAIWDSDGRITHEGYIVEMAIPFSSLYFQRTEGDQIWGFDAVRSYPRNVRHHIGSFPRDRNNNCYMCQADKLIGFAGASPGNNIEIVPTVNALITQERTDGTTGQFYDKEKKSEPGITAQWGITPNITFSGTLNPDFSNIEADILQLDINNQFALYYPEKRPFFLESADFFHTPIDAVHTRTLADPQWGVKVSGREGIHTVGFFSARDDITNYLFPGADGSSSGSVNENSHGSALRYKADISHSSNVGFLATDRRGPDYFNRVAGIDGDIKFSQKDRIMMQVLGSQTQYSDYISQEYDQPGHQFGGYYYNTYYEHNTRNYRLHARHQEADRNFRADLGFVSMVGFKYTELGAQYRWQEAPGHWYTWLSLFTTFDYRREQNNDLLHRVWSAGFNYEGPLQSHFSLYGETGKDRYEGIEFDANWIQGCFGLRTWAPFWFHFYWRYGDQIDYANIQPGNRLRLNPSLELNLGLRLKLEMSHTYEKLNVAGGRLYTANVNWLKMMYHFNERIFVRAILQYRDYRRNTALYQDEINAKTNGLFTQFLFSYKINPQTVFFLGYSDNYYGDQDIKFLQTNRTLFTKIGYAIGL